MHFVHLDYQDVNMARISQPIDATPVDPPDDFGQQLIDEFERRTAQSDSADPTGNVDNPRDETAEVVEGSGGVDINAPDVHTASATDDQDTQDIQDIQGDQDSQDDQVDQDTQGALGDLAVDSAAVTGTVEDQDTETETGTDDTDSAADTSDISTGPVPGYIWQEGDRTVAFTDQQVRDGLNLAAWAQNLPDATRQQFISIEAGEAVAVPRTEYAQYVAWRDNQQNDDFDLYPGTEAQEIAALKAEIEALKAGRFGTSTTPGVNPGTTTQQPGVAPASTPHMGSVVQPTTQAPAQTAFNASADATVAAMNEATAAYAAAHGFTEDQVNSLLDQAVSMNVIPTIADSLASYNPVTGGLLAAADPRQIITQALDMALVRNPQMFSQAHAPQPSAPQPSTPQPAPDIGTSTASDDAELARKKARAGSVASAPASVDPPSNKSVESMSRSEITDAMTQELAAIMGGGQ